LAKYSTNFNVRKLYIHFHQLNETKFFLKKRWFFIYVATKRIVFKKLLNYLNKMSKYEKNNEREKAKIEIDSKVLEEANKSLANTLANIKPIIPEITSIIPKETFSQVEKMTRMSEILAKQITVPKALISQFEQVERLNKQMYNIFRVPDALIKQGQIFAKMNQQLTKVFQVPTGVFGILETLRKSNFDHLFQVSKALEHLTKINTSFLSSIDPLFNVAFKWGGLLNSVSKTFKFEDEEEFKKFEYNWAGFLTVRELKKLYELWKEGKEAEVKDFFYKWFSDEKKLDNMIEDFKKNKFFSPRIRILKKTLKAHLNSDYELSIPILLSQIDGVFIEKHQGLDGKISFTNICKECKNENKIKAPLNARNISQYLLKKENQYMPFFLNHIMNTFENLRHDILHGKKLDYPDKDLSTKLIVTLLELSYSETE